MKVAFWCRGPSVPSWGVNVRERGVGEGWVVKKEREGCGALGGGVGLALDKGGEGGEKMVWSWFIRRALRWCWVLRAWFSFRVSWSLRLRRRVDSGVGAVSGRGRWRPWIECSAVSHCDQPDFHPE